MGFRQFKTGKIFFNTHASGYRYVHKISENYIVFYSISDFSHDILIEKQNKEIINDPQNGWDVLKEIDKSEIKEINEQFIIKLFKGGIRNEI